MSRLLLLLRARSAVACASFVLALPAIGCSLVLDEPTPFVEARQDAARPDRGPVLPDLAVEDAFVARDRVDMAPDACTDAGCADGDM